VETALAPSRSSSTRRIGHGVRVVAYAVFLVSFFLPAARDVPGWGAALIAISKSADGPFAFLTPVSAASSVLFVAGLAARRVRSHGAVAGAAFAAAAFNVLVWTVLFEDVDPRVGYFAWCLSFVLLGIGHGLVGRSLEPPPPPPAV